MSLKPITFPDDNGQNGKYFVTGPPSLILVTDAAGAVLAQTPYNTPRVKIDGQTLYLRKEITPSKITWKGSFKEPFPAP